MSNATRTHRSALAALAALGLALTALAPTPAAARVARGPVPWAVGESRGEDLRISLVTMDPGDDLASWWGHAALLVEDTRLGVSRVYNYGMFSFGPEMWPKFLNGRLEFWVGDAPAGWTWRVYESRNRGIRLRELDLSPAVRAETAAALAENVLPENRTYLYHHYDDNCATRIRDVIDRAAGGALSELGAVPAEMSLRDHTRRHTQHDPFMTFVLDLWLADAVDAPIERWDEAFLPSALEAMVDEATVEGPGGPRPLVKRTTVLYDADRAPTPERPAPLWPWGLALGLLSGGLALGLSLSWRRTGRRWPRVLLGLWQLVVGLAVGLPGLVLVLFYLTDHRVAQWNENVFLTSPLTLAAGLLAPALAFGRARPARWSARLWQAQAALSLLLLPLALLPGFDQDLSLTLPLLLPLNLGFAAALTLRPGTATGTAPGTARTRTRSAPGTRPSRLPTAAPE